MKVYERFVTLEEMKQSCEERGFFLSTTLHDTQGMDHVSFEGWFKDVGVMVVYNPINGRFMGRTRSDPALEFSTDSRLDAEPWFAELLDFLHRAPVVPADIKAASA